MKKNILLFGVQYMFLCTLVATDLNDRQRTAFATIAKSYAEYKNATTSKEQRNYCGLALRMARAFEVFDRKKAQELKQYAQEQQCVVDEDICLESVRKEKTGGILQHVLNEITTALEKKHPQLANQLKQEPQKNAS